jgi:chromosome segregation protein
MRLEKIKLSGFKSFVDTTTIPFMSDMVGIVGPNGCGKSNVIDAVRWVMGESSAKNLRGDQMADVIFNGSSTRKPVGQAFVELIFDNTDGTITGEYAGNRQIALKRQVNREGQSAYFLNGTRCRRKDITDLFLGTGLGPRSYAIIEQGTISRLIEAKPEELRVFLEEAAGISKYKERRRDTENRMRRTRENLERIGDLCEEIEKQCRHLKRQAGTAERYKVLKADERQIKAQLLALKWQSLHVLDIDQTQQLAQLGLKVESILAGQRELENNLEKQREGYNTQREKWNKVQAGFYAIGSEIAKAEQALQQKRFELEQHQTHYEQSSQLIQRAETDCVEGQDKLSETDKKIEQSQDFIEEAKTREKNVIQRLKVAEDDMTAWQKVWDDFTYQVAEPKRKIDVEKAKITQFDRHLIQLSNRIESAKAEESSLQQLVLEDDLSDVQHNHDELAKQHHASLLTVEALQKKITDSRTSLHQHNESLAKHRAEHARMSGRLASIEMFQQSSLGDKQKAVSHWLEEFNLTESTRLVEHLSVKDGWERAVETVLGASLQAICVDDLGNAMKGLNNLQGVDITLLSKQSISSTVMSATSLTNLVDSSFIPTSLFVGVHYAETLAEAKNLLSKLEDWESVITKSGVWLHCDRVFIKSEDKQGSALSLEKEKKSIIDRLAQLDVSITDVEQALKLAQRGLAESEQARQIQHQTETDMAKKVSSLALQMSEKTSKINQAKHRLSSIADDLRVALQEKQQDETLLANSKKLLEKTINEASELEVQRENFQQQRSVRKLALDESRTELHSEREKLHRLMLELESLRSSKALTTQNLNSIQEKLVQATAQRGKAKEALERGNQPLDKHREELDVLLQNKIKVEAELVQERQAVEQFEQAIQQIEKNRNSKEHDVQLARENMSTAKVNHQEVLVRKQTLVEQSQESGVNLDEVLSSLTEDAEEADWQQQLNQLVSKIERLGPINLTAIEELGTQSERQTYLVDQQKDLTEALETLVAAIEKIDKESRTLFKQTFDKVNSGFEKRFPKLFGGGNAYLQLTGGDILDTGITVMARPPGKRNTSIHLLSGGEKALTAVALVFAIFDLNPAPFCMLDEVDAPLDEANVGRFGELVKEMSKQVQMILITHNKATMEIAQHLSGVTMKEPGVSRIVSVDIEEATDMVVS